MLHTLCKAMYLVIGFVTLKDLEYTYFTMTFNVYSEIIIEY